MYTKIVRGCFVCKAPQVKRIFKKGRLQYQCIACHSISARCLELQGPTKVQKTPKGPMHFSAGALIERDGTYLIQKRATYPFLYATLGGHVDKGETMVRALAREIKEETGLTLKDKKLIFKGIINPDPCSRGVDIHYWNLFLVHAQGVLKANRHESVDLHWYTKHRMRKLRFTRPVTFIFQKLGFFKKKKGKRA